jgi:hypothetical protein
MTNDNPPVAEVNQSNIHPREMVTAGPSRFTCELQFFREFQSCDLFCAGPSISYSAVAGPYGTRQKPSARFNNQPLIKREPRVPTSSNLLSRPTEIVSFILVAHVAGNYRFFHDKIVSDTIQ